MKDEYESYDNTEFEPYKVRVTVPVLNVRANADKKAKVVKTINAGNYTIVEEKNGFGLLKSYESGHNGWVSLEFVDRI